MITLKNKHMELMLHEGLLFVHYADQLHITLEIAKDCVEDRIKLSSGKVYPMFADIRSICKVDEDALKYLSSSDAIRYISAGAFLLESKYHKILATTFIWFYRPPVPTKFFTDEKMAIHWLEYYKRECLN